MHDSATSAASRLFPAVLLATVGGVGYAPFAPGTFGAAVGLPLSLVTGWAAARLASVGLPALAIEAALVAAICLVGIPICTRAAAAIGRKDPGMIVFDETASMPLALLVVPSEARNGTMLAVAFVLLRIFDIAKPFPCRTLERLPAGLGIMADDWAAAAWTAACLAVARWQGWI